MSIAETATGEGAGLAGSLSAEDPSSRIESAALDQAVLSTVAYGDVFDFPATAEEIWRRLIGRVASQEEVAEALASAPLLRASLSCVDGFYCLSGREHLIDTRKRRRVAAEGLWSEARGYGRLLASVPFVRGVMVTGALASENEGEDGDVDFMVSIQAGAVWRSHAIIWCLVKLDRLFGSGRLCVNYYLSEDSPALEEQTLYVAYELALMIPLYGDAVYRSIRDRNQWSHTLLRNAEAAPRRASSVDPRWPRSKRAGEALLGSAFGRWLEERVKALKVSRVERREQTVTAIDAARAEEIEDGWARSERGRRVAEYQEEGRGFRGRHTETELTLCDLDFGAAILAEHGRRLRSALSRAEEMSP